MTEHFEICENSDKSLTLKNLSGDRTYHFDFNSIGYIILSTTLSENHQWSSVDNSIDTKVAEFLIKHLDETQ